MKAAGNVMDEQQPIMDQSNLEVTNMCRTKMILVMGFLGLAAASPAMAWDFGFNFDFGRECRYDPPVVIHEPVYAPPVVVHERVWAPPPRVVCERVWAPPVVVKKECKPVVVFRPCEKKVVAFVPRHDRPRYVVDRPREQHRVIVRSRH